MEQKRSVIMIYPKSLRSKATISECINQTEAEWKELQRKVAEAKEIEKVS
jgi:hypothetical protein